MSTIDYPETQLMIPRPKADNDLVRQQLEFERILRDDKARYSTAGMSTFDFKDWLEKWREEERSAVSDQGVISGDQLHKLTAQVKNVTKERDDLRRLFRRLLAEMPAIIRDQEDPIKAMVAYFEEVRDREARLDIEHQCAQRRAAEAEIALEESRESCTCGAIEHAKEGAAKLFDRLEGTVSGKVVAPVDSEEDISLRQIMELKKLQHQMMIQQAAPPMLVRGIDWPDLSQEPGKITEMPKTARGVMIMQEQPVRVGNYGR